MTVYKLLERAQRITVLTGAGVSVGAGIPDFKTLDATWPYPESRSEIMSLPYFLQEPDNFWKVYREIFGGFNDAQPGVFHQWLAALEVHKDITIFTQNVDGLHHKAGSKKVFEFHGNNHSLVCIQVGDLGCGALYSAAGVFDRDDIPHCECGAVLKPNLSLFFEGVNHMADAREAIRDSDLLLVAGTALEVGPVNELPFVAEYATPPVKSIYIGPLPPASDYSFSEIYSGTVEDFLS